MWSIQIPSRPTKIENKNDAGLGVGSQSGKALLCKPEVPSLINKTIYKLGMVVGVYKPALGSQEPVDPSCSLPSQPM